MNTTLKIVASLFAGVLGFLLVGVGVTEALDPYVWPSAMLGLPAGLTAGVATVLLSYPALTYREEIAADGEPSERTVRRLRATVAGIVGFVVGGGLATVVLWTQVVGLATAILAGGLPVGLLGAALAAYLGYRRGRANRGSHFRASP